MGSSGERLTLSADGNSTEYGTVGPVRMSLSGSFGGGTAKLQAKDPSGAWVDVAGGSFTIAADQLFDFPEHTQNQLRVNMAGSTTPTLVIWIQSSLAR